MLHTGLCVDCVERASHSDFMYVFGDTFLQHGKSPGLINNIFLQQICLKASYLAK